jgi:L-fuconolactonase
MNRRLFLKSAASTAAIAATAPAFAAPAAMPVIDTHIHLFDPTRPGGVPWPEKSDTVLFHPALPTRYAKLSRPHGVVGAIAIECSPWLVDNFWLHDVVQSSPIMLGFIGDLEPSAPDFATTLDRLHRTPLFLGIRYGNLWDRDPTAAARNPQFIAGLKLLAQAGLVLDTANPNPALLSAIVDISDGVPNLRIVLDHLPNADLPAEPQARASYETTLRTLMQRPNIFVKGSEILRRVNGQVSLDLSRYKDALDQLWSTFGEDRMLFGSDWPNSDSLVNYDDTFSIAQRYIATRSPEAQQKYFWKNSIAAYRWKPRTAEQVQLHHA